MGFDLDELKINCFKSKGDLMSKDGKSNTAVHAKLDLFRNATSCVALEITPACDFHQSNRRSASFLLGLCCDDKDGEKYANAKDSCKKTHQMKDRFSVGNPKVSFVFCAVYRFALPLGPTPAWMKDRLRLRDLVVTDIRNWASAQASRVGYLSV
jgi:hypothetical protein